MKDLFFKILDMSVTASWVILAVMAVRFLLRKAPKKYSYALWVAALFRLLCPVSIQSVVSAFNFAPFHRATLQTTGELQFVPSDVRMVEINTGIPVVDAVINTGTPVVDAAVSAPVPVAPPVVTPAVTVTPMQMLVFIGMVAWVIGMMTMVTISIVNYIKLRKDLRFAVRMRDNIWQCETVRSPFLVGLVKPKIYLPYGLDGQTQEYILAHEQYHLKRLDHIAKLLGYAALTIHWFNPLCHLAFRLMNSDMEMSCDEYVLDRNNIPTTQYSYSLLTIATNRRFPAATPLAFAESGVKERMINVLKWKKPKKWVSVVAVMVCTILLISCATNPKVTTPSGDEPAVDTTATTNPVEDELKVGDPALLELPGMKWGATLEEVKAVLNLPEENYLFDDQYRDGHWLMIVKDASFFGEEVAYGRFWFTKEPGVQDWALRNAQLYYKDETDMAAVKNTLTEHYGEPNVGRGFARYLISRGEVSPYVDKGFTEVYSDTTEAVHSWWQSEAKKADVLSDEIQEKMIASGIIDTGGAGIGLDTADPASRDLVLEYLQKESAVRMYCTNGLASTNMPMPQYATSNAVVFDAGDYIWAQQYFQLNQVGNNHVDNDSMLEFPGLKWGMTPEEVKQTLNITVEQILKDEQYEWPEDMQQSHEQWNLYVKDLTIFGCKVSLADFQFISKSEESSSHVDFVYHTGGRFALSNIRVFLEEDTDMEKLEQELSDYYGQNVGGEYRYDSVVTTFKPNKAGMTANEFLRAYARAYQAGKDNPFTAALEDPDYMEQLWVCTDPKAITDEMYAFIENGLTDNGYSKEEIDGWMNQTPWISMRFTNTTYQAILIEMGEFKSIYADYITNNYLEYRASMMAAVAQRVALDNVPQ